jgi:Rad3-related DNA helicase
MTWRMTHLALVVAVGVPYQVPANPSLSERTKYLRKPGERHERKTDRIFVPD